jgi:transposase-like protein
LLGVVSHVFAVAVFVLWVGLEKRKVKLNLDVRNIFAMSETEHRWRCSYTNLMDGSIQTWDKLPLQSWNNTID